MKTSVEVAAWLGATSLIPLGFFVFKIPCIISGPGLVDPLPPCPSVAPGLILISAGVVFTSSLILRRLSLVMGRRKASIRQGHD